MSDNLKSILKRRLPNIMCWPVNNYMYSTHLANGGSSGIEGLPCILLPEIKFVLDHNSEIYGNGYEQES